MLWALIRMILMSTHNVFFYAEILKIISKLSSNTRLINFTALGKTRSRVIL